MNGAACNACPRRRDSRERRVPAGEAQPIRIGLMEAFHDAKYLAHNDRVEPRAFKDEKRLLSTAAVYERLDVTSFIVRNVLPAARQVVERVDGT